MINISMKLSKKSTQVLLPSFIITTTLVGISTNTLAATISKELLFETSNQSMWQEGQGFIIEDQRSFGVDWDKEQCILGCDNILLSTTGDIKLENTFKFDGGSVNANIPISFTLTLPDEKIRPNDVFQVDTGYTILPSAKFETFSPTISDKLDLILDADAKFEVDIEVPLLPDIEFSKGFDVDKTYNILDISSSNLNYETDTKFASLDVKLPEINTSGTKQSANTLTSSGKDRFAEGTLKVDQIITALTPVPSLNGTLESKNGKFKASYNLLTANATVDLEAQQDFNLIIQDLPATLVWRAKNGLAVDVTPFNLGETLNVVAKPEWYDQGWAGDGFISINMDALFSNSTNLEILPGFELSGLGASIKTDFKLLPNINTSVGPLFEIDKEFNTPPINVYNNNFTLGGFNRERISIKVETVPEPITGLVIAAGLGGAALKRAKNKSKKN